MSAAQAAPIDAVIARVKGVYRGWGRATTVGQMRSDWDALFAVDAPRAAAQTVSAGGVSAQWIGAPGARDDAAILYFHGGGVQVGSVRSHRELIECIAHASGCRALGVDYRRAPEHRFPAQIDDALAAYEWLLAQGIAPARIALAGDSAGAGLALAAMLSLRDRGRPLPAAAVLMSAWTDLTASGESYASRSAADPIHQRAMILSLAKGVLGPDGDARNPLASPLFADLHGLPPLLMQAGDRETVLDDSVRFAAKARAAGVAVELEVWPGMIHVFQQFPRELAEAREAIRVIGAFLKARLAPSPQPSPPNTGAREPAPSPSPARGRGPG